MVAKRCSLLSGRWPSARSSAEGWRAQHLAVGVDRLAQNFNAMGDEQKARFSALLFAEALSTNRRNNGFTCAGGGDDEIARYDQRRRSLARAGRAWPAGRPWAAGRTRWVSRSVQSMCPWPAAAHGAAPRWISSCRSKRWNSGSFQRVSKWASAAAEEICLAGLGEFDSPFDAAQQRSGSVGAADVGGAETGGASETARP